MYIAGLELPFGISPSQLSESLVWSTLFVSHYRLIRQQRQSFATANKEGGAIVRTPTTLAGKLVTPVHAIATMLLPIAYIVAMPLLRFQQPEWMERYTLPDGGLSAHQKVALRFGAGLLVCAAAEMAISTTRQLGRSFHAISVRERPKVVSTGAYGIVRHPLYTLALVMQLAYAPITWNYLPLIGFAVTAVSFAIKMPIEEELIEADVAVRDEYLEYKKRVPYKIIPYIW